MFARAYDLLMSDVDYASIYDWMKPYIKPTDTIIDAGCGSGYLLMEFLKHNHPAIGIDIDSNMLSIAQERLIKEGLPVMLYEHDIRLSLGVKSDVIVMMFDVINYFKGAKKVFYHLYQALEENGRLIFDMYKESVLEDYQDYIETDDDPIAYRWHMTSKNHVLNHKLEIEDEIDYVKQYVYPLSYYLDLLKALGFDVKVTDGPDERKHYVIAYKL